MTNQSFPISRKIASDDTMFWPTIMIDLVLLPGNSPANKQWIDQLAEVLDPHAKRVKSLYYSHWVTGNGLINLEQEQDKLVALAQDLIEYAVVAKSVGVLLALEAIFKKKITPQKCVFIGSALKWGKYYQLDVDSWLQGYATPTLFIQKKHDPATPAEELRHLLTRSGVFNYKFEQLAGNDHGYDNLNQLKDLIVNFLQTAHQ